MATNAQMILNKLARNLQIMGFTVATQGQVTQTTAQNPNLPNNVVEPLISITGDSTTYYVSYLPSTFSPAGIGGVSPEVSPYLGIGSANPGQLLLQSTSGTTAANVIAGPVGLQVFASMASFANDIVIASNTNGGGGFGNPAMPGDQLARIRGQSDLLNMGQ
jgi:hypothetical protein